MRQIMTVFAFTFREGIRKKVFIVSTIIMMALLLILTAVPALIQKSETNEPESGAQEPSVTSKVCYYVDENGLIDNAIETLSSKITDTRFEKGDYSKIHEYKETIKTDGNTSLIVVSSDHTGSPFITVTNMDFMSGISSGYAVDVLSDLYIYNTLESRGIDKDTIEFAQSRLSYAEEFAGEMDFSGYLLGIVITMLVFFAVYFYGYGVSMSVATEKTSRVMETLIVSAKPSRILIGKCLGMGALGLFQFIFMIAFGTVCYKFFIPDGFTVFGMELTLSAFTFKSALFTFIYFLLGYMLYSMLNAVSGAFVSKIEDLNSAMMPVMLIELLSFYMGYFSMMSSGSNVLQKITMYVPFSSPFIMPFILLNKDLSDLDLAVSILILVISIVIVTVLSIKVYTASVMRYGKRVRLKDLYKET